MTDRDVLRDAYAVLFPAYGDIPGPSEVSGFLQAGGVSVLLGCTREEYVARRMLPDRILQEDSSTFATFADQARAVAGGAVLIAIDYEIGGIHRLHDLGPQLTHPSVALEMTASDIEAFGASAARAAHSLGINLFLAPVLDFLTGPNDWLHNRCLDAGPERVAQITSAFIRGVQANAVSATAKHFPGYPSLASDPYDDAEVRLEIPAAALAPGLVPFKAAIAAGVHAVMVGPAPVTAIDPVEPASTSQAVVHCLREELGFGGLVISDDLDLPGVLRGRRLSEVALAGLDAGVQLLLLAAGPQVDHVAVALAEAAARDSGRRRKLSAAAASVRDLARRLG